MLRDSTDNGVERDKGAPSSDSFWSAPALWRFFTDTAFGSPHPSCHLVRPWSPKKAAEGCRTPKRFASSGFKLRGNGSRAFTLIELMVVLVLIGIMSAALIPEMKGTFEDALLRSTGRKLVTVFSLASSRAIAINQLHRVRFDIKNSRYTVERGVREDEGGTGFVSLHDLPGGDGDLDNRVSILIRNSNDESKDSPDTAPPLRSEKDLGESTEENAISFYPGGTADAREIILRDREGFRLSLRIDATTARVHIVELDRQ